MAVLTSVRMLCVRLPASFRFRDALRLRPSSLSHVPRHSGLGGDVQEAERQHAHDYTARTRQLEPAATPVRRALCPHPPSGGHRQFARGLT